MAADQRPVSDYGLVVNRHWVRHLFSGVLIGAAIYGLYVLVCLWMGVFSVRLDALTERHFVSFAKTIAEAFVTAALLQIVFSGYLPSKLRDYLPVGVAVGASSLLFAVSQANGLSSADIQLATGMFLTSVLLCTVRMLIGNLSFPTGLLAGAILFRLTTKRIQLFSADEGAEWSAWLAPNGDPLQGPAMWCGLLVVVASTSRALWRGGEYKLTAGQPALDASFKRLMPLSNLLGLAPLDLWIGKLRQARMAIGFKYLPRFIASMVGSTVNTVLILPERIVAPLLLKHDVPDPVFIIGIHRSGTTHLHKLLSLDPRYCTPRNYQVFNPHGFLTGWLTTLILGPFLIWRRPMDSVQLTPFSPQEEEFAVAAMTPYSPYWFACFPRLYASHERFIYPERMTSDELASWSRHYVLFLRKLTCWSRKHPLLKSPYNTARVAALRRLFPGAKFIHIARNPYDTYRSNMHLAEHGWVVFQLQDPDPEQTFASGFLRNYRDQELAYYRDAEQLPAHDIAEVRFEDLEADPIAQLRRLYSELDLEFTPEYEARLDAYLASIAGYRKNRFQSLPEDQLRAINEAVGDLAERQGYDLVARHETDQPAPDNATTPK